VPWSLLPAASPPATTTTLTPIRPRPPRLVLPTAATTRSVSL
jgi:hypothetical protein